MLQLRTPPLAQPVTVAAVLALGVTAATLAGASPAGASAMILAASTNLANMVTHPLAVLVASAFYVPAAWTFWPLAALVVLVVGVAERRLGAVRTVLLFGLGHVGATLVTLAGIAVGIDRGWLPSSLATAADVGPSYGLAAVGAVLLVGLPSRRSRVALALLLTTLAVAVVLNRTPADAGHLVAALLGLLAARAPARRRLT